MKKVYPIFLIIIFIFISNGCSKQVANKATEKIYMNIKANHYDTIEKLYKNSSIVIIGDVVKSKDTWKGTFKSIDINEQVYTQVFVKISEVIKGREVQEVGNTLLLNQPGGIYKNVDYIEKNTEYLEQGKKYILVLNDEGNGNYTLISPYEGMLEVVNDNALPRPENSILTSKLTVNQFREKLAEILCK